MGFATGQPGQVFGRAGGGMDNATWAKNDAVARIGKSGEIRTAAVLDVLARRPGGPTVMHDLKIPIPGISANIDHLVISGRTLYLIDAKVWKPGFYWTTGGTTRRGLARFAPADKKTMPMASAALARYLVPRTRGGVTVATPLLVVWPSSERSTTHLWAMSSPGANVIGSAKFTARAHRMVGTKPADPDLVQALLPLVNGLQARRSAAAA